jgi:hypothetical protein
LHRLERRLPIARQFVTFDGDQRSEVKKAKANKERGWFEPWVN